MSLNIKNERVQKLAPELAAATGETMATAIGEALQERLDRAGNGGDVRLDIGDCFAYALAKTRNKPLLFKGNDFRQTGIEEAL